MALAASDVAVLLPPAWDGLTAALLGAASIALAADLAVTAVAGRPAVRSLWWWLALLGALSLLPDALVWARRAHGLDTCVAAPAPLPAS